MNSPSKDIPVTFAFFLMITATILLSLILRLRAELDKRRPATVPTAKRHPESLAISDVDEMTGRQFENYLAGLLRARGCTNVRLTQTYDLGVDIIATYQGVTWGIQAKRQGSHVRLGAVRAVYSALQYYNCDRAMVITNSFYTGQAWRLARSNHTVLVGRHELSQWIDEFNRQTSSDEPTQTSETPIRNLL
jgi:HJR/Mrr/RecB family endonuclease